jgi:uncharacterized protein YecE (DUF72 family)
MDKRAGIQLFRFRDFYPHVLIGMASDRYAGWIGQVYTEGRYTQGITQRTHKVGDKTFVEKVLPVESVQEYFEHFPILEIDFTFYRLLLDEGGKPTQNYHVLRSYRGYMTEKDSVILKVPQVITARRLRRGGASVDNETYLNPRIFTEQFYKPANEILQSNLAGFAFEQEYHLKKDRFEPDQLAADLDSFFCRIPKDTRYHIELRTEAYLSDPVFGVLEKHGVGLVFSHWTWLPPLKKQFKKTGGRFFNSGNQSIIRLITPFRMSYEESYAMAFPFDKMVDGMLNPPMIEDVIDLIMEGMKNREGRMIIIINNRAGGNGPLIAQSISKRLLAT